MSTTPESGKEADDCECSFAALVQDCGSRKIMLAVLPADCTGAPSYMRITLEQANTMLEYDRRNHPRPPDAPPWSEDTRIARTCHTDAITRTVTRVRSLRLKMLTAS